MQDRLIMVWKNVAKRLHGTFEQKKDTDYFHNHEAYELTCHYDKHKVIVTAYLQLIPERGRGPFLTHFTKVYVCFYNQQKVYFKIAKNSFLSSICNLISPQIKTPNSTFNKRFNLSGQPRFKVASIFSNQEILQPIVDFDDIYLEVIHNNKFASSFAPPNNEDVLEVNVNYVLNNEEQILNLIHLSTLLVEEVTSIRI
ncbi:hypothetical protein OCK74_08835 [Chitinophagaceae bacterium LB-8]|uniref:Uncharacterized protein n=1 Tax=Paraflavisolibacter caeni TaxID=2982496 RepID=A0A9X3BFM5_9BACT|nr:hypothetical protein [Paraflavisolibacter caeni]MCU7549219.1 hypothetical protein [Paraflavisolibacter caeni]